MTRFARIYATLFGFYGCNVPVYARHALQPEESAHPGVWHWTDEYVDEHTGTAIVCGGSKYQAQCSSGTYRKPIATVDVANYS